jgi:hypothetical protein
MPLLACATINKKISAPAHGNYNNLKPIVSAREFDTRELLCYNTNQLVIGFEFHMVTALLTATITDLVLLSGE